MFSSLEPVDVSAKKSRNLRPNELRFELGCRFLPRLSFGDVARLPRAFSEGQVGLKSGSKWAGG
jgi:hypothetical protein